MAMMNCPECGKEISNSAVSCPNCGYVIGKMKFCKFCGEKIPEDNVICTKCGKQVENNSFDDNRVIINNNNNASSSASASATAFATPVYTGKAVSKWTAFILCILLGCLGAHKFYEGKTVMGIIYLCTCGLCGIGVIVDAISILCKPDPYYV